ncbi:MAG: hypothetical protein H0W08_05225 [Acidobacteria bacterium]|nr:hypothetical protein [Acidobacteriota bacterium]
MKPTLLFGFGILVAGIAFVCLPVGRVGSPAPSATPSPAEPRPSVQVRHELIAIPVPMARVINRRAAPPPAFRAALNGRPVPRPATRQAGQSAPDVHLLEKARRVVVGDGRHKPEPFPRLRNN